MVPDNKSSRNSSIIFSNLFIILFIIIAITLVSPVVLLVCFKFSTMSIIMSFISLVLSMFSILYLSVLVFSYGTSDWDDLVQPFISKSNVASTLQMSDTDEFVKSLDSFRARLTKFTVTTDRCLTADATAIERELSVFCETVVKFHLIDLNDVTHLLYVYLPKVSDILESYRAATYLTPTDEIVKTKHKLHECLQTFIDYLKQMNKIAINSNLVENTIYLAKAVKKKLQLQT